MLLAARFEVVRGGRCFFAGLLAAVSIVMAAQQPSVARVIVRATGKGTVQPLQPDDLRVEYGGHAVGAMSLQPLLSSGTGSFADADRLELMLLIDNGLQGNIALKLPDIVAFVRSIASPRVAVGVAYMRKGYAVFTAPISTDPQVAVKGIRMPTGPADISGNTYDCLRDLIDRWPTTTGAPRVVLMIADGLDVYSEPIIIPFQGSPYAAAATAHAQRTGMPVYSIYYGDHVGRGAYPGLIYLEQIADGTGGRNFNESYVPPTSLAPLLTEFTAALRESYVLRFAATGNKLQRLKVSGPKGVKISVQNQAQP